MDWFKMQTVWGASIERFSDAEAGRFIKAVYAYVRHGEEYDGGSGREDPVIWQALETLRGDIESFKRNEANQKAQEEALKEKRRAAAKARWQMQNDASASKRMQNDASASESTICIASASQNKNKNKEEDIKKRVSKDTLKESAAFDTFWTAYPRHTNKKAAQQAFQKINPDADLLNIMLQSVSAWKLSQQWTKDGGQYIPHAATWLNGRRWEDEVPKAAAFTGKQVSAQQYTQRQYTEDELMAVSDDLLAEARANRGKTA